MSYSNQTLHYGLPLPTSSDRSVWTDNNTAFEAIDDAIYTASQNASGASEAVTAMATTVTGHTASIATLNADVATLSTSVTGLETDLDSAESAIASIDTRLTTAESDIISKTSATIENLYTSGNYSIALVKNGGLKILEISGANVVDSDFLNVLTNANALPRHTASNNIICYVNGAYSAGRLSISYSAITVQAIVNGEFTDVTASARIFGEIVYA